MFILQAITVISFIWLAVKIMPFVCRICLPNKVGIDVVYVWLDIELKVLFHFVSLKIGLDETQPLVNFALCCIRPNVPKMAQTEYKNFQLYVLRDTG